MTQAIAKYAARKMLSSEMNKYKDKAPAGEYVSRHQHGRTHSILLHIVTAPAS